MHAARAQLERSACRQQGRTDHAIRSADYHRRTEQSLMAVVRARFEEGGDLLLGECRDACAHTQAIAGWR